MTEIEIEIFRDKLTNVECDMYLDAWPPYNIEWFYFFTKINEIFLTKFLFFCVNHLSLLVGGAHIWNYKQKYNCNYVKWEKNEELKVTDTRQLSLREMSNEKCKCIFLFLMHCDVISQLNSFTFETLKS